MTTKDEELRDASFTERDTTVQIGTTGSTGVVTELVDDLVGGFGISAEQQTVQDPVARDAATVELTPDCYEAVKDLAAERGRSVPQTISDAVRLAARVHAIERENGRLLIERDGKLQELVLV